MKLQFYYNKKKKFRPLLNVHSFAGERLETITD